MGRRRSYIPLNIFLNNRLVGQMERQKGGAINFQYAREWLDWDASMPISLSLPLTQDRYTGGAVLAVFENLLPDNEAILRRVAERTGAQGTDAYSMLSAIGRDCVGALQFVPEGEDSTPSEKIEGRPLTDAQIGNLLKNLDVSPLGIRPENDFRISIAGAQEKTALLFHEGQWMEPVGTTPTTHIIKPQIGKLPNGMDLSNSVENEFVCLKLMENFGLRVAKAEIQTFAKQKALVVERFDRLWTRNKRLIRLPQEDCCQALSVPPTQKYENVGGPGIPAIMELLRASDEPNKDQRDFFKANILFWLIGATDGHAKNFSINILSGGRFRMSPLYDVLTAEPEYAANRIRRKDYKLAMKWGKSRHYKITDIRAHHIQETGLESGLSREAIQEVIQEILDDAAPALEKTIRALPKSFPQVLIDALSGAIESRCKILQ